MEIAEHELQRIVNLASHRHCTEHIQATWSEFLSKRDDRLQQEKRLGEACEKVAENILEDLFTTVLDWPLADFNNQVDRADLVLTNHGIKWLVVEVKRPGSLAWSRRAVEGALAQAVRYANEQKIKTVAVSDGVMLYAANIVDGGLRDRVFVRLSDSEPQLDLWWLSVQGIWREREFNREAKLRILPEEAIEATSVGTGEDAEGPLHPKYHLPAQCFAYVGDYSNPHSWKLPYLTTEGTIDTKRLPKAIQCILSNYRGAKVSGIPEEAIPAVLVRLARAARQAGHMPPTACKPAPTYRQLADALQQLGLSAGVSGH